MEEPIILVESEEKAPTNVEAAEEPQKPKKKLGKKAKLAIILTLVILILGGGVAALMLFVFKKDEPVIILSDLDILTSGSWEKRDAPSVIWTFREDGTGELTTNKKNYYSTKWTLSDEEDGQKLDITTKWLYDLNDSFTFKLDRDNNSFTVKNLADETESVFVPLGTAEKEAAERANQPEEPAELEKTEE